MVNAILTLARALGMQVVAEGIETAAHVGELRGLGCELGQGYHYACLVPAAEARVLARATLPIPQLVAALPATPTELGTDTVNAADGAHVSAASSGAPRRLTRGYSNRFVAVKAS
jgi:EAL domain-containing protein (putative c-di-GMP-specific phosphodiesterase class I)